MARRRDVGETWRGRAKDVRRPSRWETSAAIRLGGVRLCRFVSGTDGSRRPVPLSFARLDMAKAFDSDSVDESGRRSGLWR